MRPEMVARAAPGSSPDLARLLAPEPALEPSTREPARAPHPAPMAVAGDQATIRPPPEASAGHGGPAPARATPAETPPTPPTIRVSIGRIEVRAIESPAPPARRAERPRAAMSLEEYLRSTDGGPR